MSGIPQPKFSKGDKVITDGYGTGTVSRITYAIKRGAPSYRYHLEEHPSTFFFEWELKQV